MKPFNLEAAKNGAAVVTRDGRKARIICFDVIGDTYKMAALVAGADDGAEDVFTFGADGSFMAMGDSYLDLLMAPVKKECWINFYGFAHGCSQPYATEKMAKNSAEDNLISCIHHTWEE